jgi:hypothetical protein
MNIVQYLGSLFDLLLYAGPFAIPAATAGWYSSKLLDGGGWKRLAVACIGLWVTSWLLWNIRALYWLGNTPHKFRIEVAKDTAELFGWLAFIFFGILVGLRKVDFGQIPRPWFAACLGLILFPVALWVLISVGGMLINSR